MGVVPKLETIWKYKSDINQSVLLRGEDKPTFENVSAVLYKYDL